MKGFILTKLGRTLMLAAAVAVGLSGCEDNGANNGGGGGGGSYESVTIGGKRWMKKNLNVVTADSWCYEDSIANCDKYGRLYTWSAAKKVCPSGWRLPDTADWNKLINAAGGPESAGMKLRTTSGWHYNNGTDEMGFSALPGGYRLEVDYGSEGWAGGWWTATERSDNYAYNMLITTFNDYVEGNAVRKNYVYSVRCVHN